MINENFKFCASDGFASFGESAITKKKDLVYYSR